MFWGKSIFPRFAVDRSLPSGAQAPRPAEDPCAVPGSELPIDIANAISHATFTAFTAFIVGLVTCDDLEAEEQARVNFKAARAAADAVILRHLRGEA